MKAGVGVQGTGERRLASVTALFLVLLLCPVYAFSQTAPIVFAIMPDAPHPGEPLTIAAIGVGAEDVVSLYNEQGRRLSRARFFYYMAADRIEPVEKEAPAAPSPTGIPAETPVVLSTKTPVSCMAAVLAIPSTAGSGSFVIRLESLAAGTVGVPERVLAQQRIEVLPRQFAAERIPLNQANTDIRTVPDPEKTAQANELAAILARTGNTVYAEGLFATPIPPNTRKTSFFGDRRVYVYTTGGEDTSIHAGIDYGVPRGTPVYACARGRVALAKFRISTGFSVVLEHLPGVYSLYYHLDSMSVEEGAVIEQGAEIGRSGSTGLATGPHLHWEMRVSRENTDPEAFAKSAVLDKKLIMSRLGLR